MEKSAWRSKPNPPALSFYESLENMKDNNKDTVFVLVHVYSAELTYLHSELNIVFKIPFGVGERTQLLQFMWFILPSG